MKLIKTLGAIFSAVFIAAGVFLVSDSVRVLLSGISVWGKLLLGFMFFGAVIAWGTSVKPWK